MTILLYGLLGFLCVVDDHWATFVGSTQAKAIFLAIGIIIALHPFDKLRKWWNSRLYRLKLCDSRPRSKGLRDLNKRKLATSSAHEDHDEAEDDEAEDSEREGSMNSQRSRIEKGSILAQYPMRKSFLGRTKRDLRSDRVWAQLSLEDMHVEPWGGWMEADPGLVMLKQDNANQADPCSGFLLTLKHVDVFTVDYKLFNVASLSHSYHQTNLLHQGGGLTFVVNFLFPGTKQSSPFNTVAYFQLAPEEKRTVDGESYAACKNFFARFQEGSGCLSLLFSHKPTPHAHNKLNTLKHIETFNTSIQFKYIHIQHTIWFR